MALAIRRRRPAVALIFSLAMLLNLGAAPKTAHGAGDLVAYSLPLPAAATDLAPTALSPASDQTRPCPRTPRSTIDRPDLVEGPAIHVIYLLAADAPDEHLDVNGVLSCSMHAQNAWLEGQVGLRWRLDTFEHQVTTRAGRTRRVPRLDVTFVRSHKPAVEIDGAFAVRDELATRGFADPDKRYLTFVMTRYMRQCGDAIYPISVHASQQRDGKYAQVYLSSSEACHADKFGSGSQPSWAEAIAQQELLHTEGLAPIGAPHSCPMVLPFAHVCTGALHYTESNYALDPERKDVLYPYLSAALSEKVIDIGRDDYYGHNLPIGDLEDSVYLTDD